MDQMPVMPDEMPVVHQKVYNGPRNIEVEALAKGFFDQHRKNEGDLFVIPTMKQLGSWMKCKDPKIQKMHDEAMRVKRMKANTAED